MPSTFKTTYNFGKLVAFKRGDEYINWTFYATNFWCFKLAKIYRLVDLFQWSQGIYNHITICICSNICIGASVKIEEGVRLVDSSILPDATIHAHSFISNSIFGRKCVVGACVLPHKSIAASVPNPTIIM
uniref:Acyltransferase n=1 Tax=Meloidogyne hapla TaxID=6305 RepID=A0A1I8BGL6_MELHA